jgi:hypothetical protein
MAGDLNAKHTDWNSRLIRARGSMLRDYAKRNCCFICGPDARTTLLQHTMRSWKSLILWLSRIWSYRSSACPALSSDHLPILIVTTCRSSFQNLLDRPDLTRKDWAAFQVCLDDRLPGNLAANDEEVTDKCVEELISAIQEATAASAPKCRPRAESGPLHPLVFRIPYAWRTGWGGSSTSSGTPISKPRSTVSKVHDSSAERVQEQTVER